MSKLKTATAVLALMTAPAFAYESTKDETSAIPKQETAATMHDAQNDAEIAASAPEMDGDMGETEIVAPETAETTPPADTEYMTDGAEETDLAEATPEADAEIGEMDASTPELAQLNTDFDVDGWSEVDNQWSAEDVTGMRLYDANNEWIGEIDEVVMGQNGKIDGAVLGVGGFVGIGEKDVLVSFDSLKIKQEEGGDDMRVYVNLTEEELERMPSYEG